ncbi:MAG: Gfo/Idh/MocA family oxidoreductase [Paracoccaceae bacterium]
MTTPMNVGPMKVGIIGCGNISGAYMRLAPLYRDIEVVACADVSMEAAKARAAEFGLCALSVDDLLASDDIDIVVNLTIPEAHYPVMKRILDSGKHAYSEKPFVLAMTETTELAKLAQENGLRVGSAPDTFLGGAHQQARALVDSGALGKITSGSAMVLNHGMEHWHPNPDFFFQPGAGPMLDIGPYYVTALVNILGPVIRVAALTTSASDTRVIKSEPRKGETLQVNTPTNIQALFHFENDATVSIVTSWDVWAHRHENLELYGTEGSLYIPDPNFFGGAIIAGGADNADMETLPEWDHPFGKANETNGAGEPQANYRTAGLADMAAAIRENRPHRCSLELASHVIDVMTATLKSGETGAFVTLDSTCTRPDPLTPDQARALMK